MNLDLLREQLALNKNKYKNINDFFKAIGLDIVNHRGITPSSSVELPARIYRGSLNRVNISAFSYIGGESFIYDTDLKRYCSLAKNIYIGQGNHPMTWLSSNPFQYQQSFRIQTGELFPYHDEYSSYYIDETFRREVKKEVSLPNTVIGNDVWIGVGAIILPGVKIGDGAIIGGGSIVTKDIPPYAIAVGNPARVIKYRFTPDIIEKLLEIKWWQYSPWDLHQFNVTFNEIYSAINTIESRAKNGDLLSYTPGFVKVEELIKLFNETVK